MVRSEVPPRSDVAYVRVRVVLSCPRCALRAVADRERGEGTGEDG